MRLGNPLHLTNHSGRFQPVHLRHLNIQESQVEISFRQGLQGFPSISNHDNLVTLLLQNALHQTLVHEVILCQ